MQNLVIQKLKNTDFANTKTILINNMDINKILVSNKVSFTKNLNIYIYCFQNRAYERGFEETHKKLEIL